MKPCGMTQTETKEYGVFHRVFLPSSADIEKITRHLVPSLQAQGTAGLTLASCLQLTPRPDLAVDKPHVSSWSYADIFLENTQQLCMPQSIVH